MRIGWLTDTITPDASRALHYTLLWGLDGVALRSIGSAEERVPFIREGPIRRRLDADEVPVLAVDPGLFEGESASRVSWMNEVESFAETASFCARLGVSRVLVGALAPSPETYDEALVASALDALGNAAQAAGLHLAVRNEAGTGVATGAALASLLARVAHPAVQADWRPLDAFLSGEDPAAGLAALPAVSCVTVRDEAADGTPAVPGEGQLDWSAQWRALHAADWDGDAILEMRGRPAGTFGLRSATAVISAVRRARRADRA